ncbi:hypothetical protein [Mesorhizobium sp. ANAO-SY3R2]|uniref:GAP1-N1 domain-containing protein n=1 Tax=Mesorhizobium sp. ANAO-SY3R2 TaxID=3166644 RepID=UPI00366FBC1B
MSLTVQQALHGYSDGHRLISCSLPLTSTDARIMLVMSDLSGTGVKPGQSGYLTGYPLEGTGQYVLARTWAAPEMPRPGCVWTHSLIIDNADLAALASADALIEAFQRPLGPSLRPGYGSPLKVLESSSKSFRGFASRNRMILNAIYAAPDQTILVEAGEPDEDERLVTAIWMQQWPRLRRSFGFCTLSGMDRSGKGVPLDLQMVRTTDRQTRSKFSNAAMPIETKPEPVLETLYADLEGLDDTRIRDFLRRAGGDVGGGRKAMIPLCRLHSALIEVSPPDLTGAVKALTALDGLAPRQARSVRMLVARRAVEELERVDDGVFDFLLDSFGQGGPYEQLLFGPRFGTAFWRRSPARFVEAIAKDGVVGQACADTLARMSMAEIIAGLDRNAHLARSIVRLRPDVLESADFWRIPDIQDDLAHGFADGAASRVAWALAAAGRTGPAPFIVERADSGDLVAALESANADASALPAWLQALARHPNRTAAALASGRVKLLWTVVTLARAGEPDDVPNDYGEDPWIIAVRHASGPVAEADQDYLAAFLMSRALGRRSRSQAELTQFAYEQLYRALEQSRLPTDVERFVTSRLDWSNWFDWDNCWRLRDTVTRRFVDYHLDPETFGRLVEDGVLATSLIDEAARSGRGRRYLAEVRQQLKNADEKAIRARADYIAKKLK